MSTSDIDRWLQLAKIALQGTGKQTDYALRERRLALERNRKVMRDRTKELRKPK